MLFSGCYGSSKPKFAIEEILKYNADQNQLVNVKKDFENIQTISGSNYKESNTTKVYSVQQVYIVAIFKQEEPLRSLKSPSSNDANLLQALYICNEDLHQQNAGREKLINQFLKIHDESNISRFHKAVESKRSSNIRLPHHDQPWQFQEHQKVHLNNEQIFGQLLKLRNSDDYATNVIEKLNSNSTSTIIIEMTFLQENSAVLSSVIFMQDNNHLTTAEFEENEWVFSNVMLSLFNSTSSYSNKRFINGSIQTRSRPMHSSDSSSSVSSGLSTSATSSSSSPNSFPMENMLKHSSSSSSTSSTSSFTENVKSTSSTSSFTESVESTNNINNLLSNESASPPDDNEEADLFHPRTSDKSLKEIDVPAHNSGHNFIEASSNGSIIDRLLNLFNFFK